MDTLLPAFQADSTDALWREASLQGAFHAVVACSLVALRLAGALSIGPLFGHPHIPLTVRALIVLGLSLVLTPALLNVDSSGMFARLDDDHDGRLFAIEVSPALSAHVQHLLVQAGKTESQPLLAEEFHGALPLPRTVVAYVQLGLAELAVGLALGFGVLVIFSALQTAGSLIDQQLGITLGAALDPEAAAAGDITGPLLQQFGLILFLLAGGHLLLLSAVLDTFQALPVGAAWVDFSLIDLLQALVQQSLSLALRVAAPVLVTLFLSGLALGYLGRTLPHVGSALLSLPLRALIGMAILSLSLTIGGDLVTRTLSQTILQLRDALTAPRTLHEGEARNLDNSSEPNLFA